MAKFGIFFFLLFVSSEKKNCMCQLVQTERNARKVPKKRSTTCCPNLQKKKSSRSFKILSVSLVNTAVGDYIKHRDQWFLTLGQFQEFGRASKKNHIYVLNLKKTLFHFSQTRGLMNLHMKLVAFGT